MQVRLFSSTAVTALGAGTLTLSYSGPARQVAVNLYNNSGVARTITLAQSGRSVSFAMADGAAETALVEQTANLDVTASGTGVFGWAAWR